MTSIPTSTQLFVLLFSLGLTAASSAGESVKNEHKNNGTGNTVSDADVTGHIDGGFSFAVSSQAIASLNSQQNATSDTHTFQQMEKRRRQMQEAQLEAYKRHLQERRQRSTANNLNTLPEDVLARRKAYIKLMDERRALMKKMMDEHREAARQRRKTMLLKMHQTSTAPEMANKA